MSTHPAPIEDSSCHLEVEQEKGRIVQREVGGPFELFMKIKGQESRLAEFATQAEAEECYGKAIRILKPAVHDPFEVSVAVVPAPVPEASNSTNGCAVHRLAMFAAIGAPLDTGERKIALKTMAAPPTEPTNKRRKIISQKGLRSNGLSVRRQIKGAAGRGRHMADGQVKGDATGGGKAPRTQFVLDRFVDACAEGLDPVELRVCALCGGDDEAMANTLGGAWDGKTLMDEACR